MKENRQKLRLFDKELGNKVIINVCWQHLSRNKEAYLSVGIQEVKLFGKKIQGCQEQIRAIKQMGCPDDFSFLVDHHLLSRSGFGKHEIANFTYFLKKTKEHLSKPPADRSDLWTVDRLVDYSGLTKNQIESMVLLPIDSREIEEALKEKRDLTLLTLETIENKINIPLNKR